jgi:hypothetical protein
MSKSVQSFHPMRLVRFFRRVLGFPKARDLAFVAVFRDEAMYLDEWIRFHHAQGVNHFFLYNDKSIDNFEKVLAPWLSQGAVTLLNSEGRVQEAIYNDGLRRARKKFNWLGFFDIDEFVFSPTGSKLPEVLNRFSDFAGVFVFWKMFGSANLQLQKEKGVLESFTSCLKSPKTPEEARQQHEEWINIRRSSGRNLTGNPLQGKSVVNLRKVKEMRIHFPDRYRGKMVDEKRRPIPRHEQLSEIYTTQRAPSMDLLRVNHYWSRGLKSLEEKVNRPGVSTNRRLNPELRPSISIALSWESSLNSSRDWAILKLWRPISSPKVFIIGFNKTATRALSTFFEANGMPSVHWDGNKLAQTMVNNLKTGEKILHGYDSHYKVYSDMISMTESERVEANSYFREMDSDYPGSFFILNNRETSSWILSRERHKGVSNFLKTNLSQMKTTDINVVRETWRLEKEAHEKEVREYFQGRRDFLELDIESDQIPKRLADFLDMDFDDSKWQIIGKTKIASNEN